tara:strand:+ start:1038 stop:1451 length:414 start_codon:yes stop_codon:yes gene_type:complete
MDHSDDSTTLDLPLPARRERTLGLVLIRRMAGQGLQDSRAAMLAMDAAGPGFPKLLVVARALVLELARTSRRRILLAPCCAAGMTRDEGLLVDMIAGGGLELHAALTDDAPCTTALSTARALGRELERVALRNGWRR